MAKLLHIIDESHLHGMTIILSSMDNERACYLVVALSEIAKQKKKKGSFGPNAVN